MPRPDCLRPATGIQATRNAVWSLTNTKPADAQSVRSVSGQKEQVRGVVFGMRAGVRGANGAAFVPMIGARPSAVGARARVGVRAFTDHAGGDCFDLCSCQTATVVGSRLLHRSPRRPHR